MEFEYIPKTHADQRFVYIKEVDKFYSFVEEFNIVGVRWSEPRMISSSYLLRLLEEGSSSKARGYGMNVYGDDEHSNDMAEFYSHLLDHGAMWKLKNGNVICTAMPYGRPDGIRENFYRMINKFNYPETIKLQFLDDRYRYRPNGDCMIMIYSDVSQEDFDPSISDAEIYKKAMQHSASALRHTQTTKNTFIRDRYVSEYAKRRAKGYCQLCGEPAPFFDYNGRPFLETHHVIWLADGGEDSINNTVALCPNCHRKMHILNLDEDVQTLLQVIDSMR
nr:HNH endonuclease [uncultured Butyrivibrio sp.]